MHNSWCSQSTVYTFHYFITCEKDVYSAICNMLSSILCRTVNIRLLKVWKWSHEINTNSYLLFWDYDRIKYILPFKQTKEEDYPARKKTLSNKFPFLFFGGVFAITASVILINHFLYDIRPGNSMLECTNGCAGNSDPKACLEFCDCIYNQGKQLHECLTDYNKAKAKGTN